MGKLAEKCSNKRCKTCPSLVTGPTFKSSVTGRTYQVRSPCGPLGCQSRNVVYLITCKQCDVQYVGETSQMLRSRMNNHIGLVPKVLSHCIFTITLILITIVLMMP